MPVVLAAYVNIKFKSNWQLWWIGGAVFILSQIGHIPFNYFTSVLLYKTSLVLWPKVYQIIFNALFLGLSAGLWEELARYSAFRWWVGEARSWNQGVQLGIGHGSFESIILGLLVSYTFIQMVAMKDIDLRSLVPQDQLSQTLNSINTYWALPWYAAILGGIERMLTMPVQIAMSVLVVQVFIQKKIKWLWIAIIFHMIVDATSVLLMSFYNVYISEWGVAFFSLISICIIFVFKTLEPKEDPDSRIEIYSRPDNNTDMLGEILKNHNLEETSENLDATKFQ